MICVGFVLEGRKSSHPPMLFICGTNYWFATCGRNKKVFSSLTHIYIYVSNQWSTHRNPYKNFLLFQYDLHFPFWDLGCFFFLPKKLPRNVSQRRSSSALRRWVSKSWPCTTAFGVTWPRHLDPLEVENLGLPKGVFHHSFSGRRAKTAKLLGVL